ncbi:MAG: NADH-quinone oxidoreductase subunit B/C/D [Thermodesulfobacteriota bacterium]
MAKGRPGIKPENRQEQRNSLTRGLDSVINWAHACSLWPMYFGLSCCFVEEITSWTPRYDIARFGAEVLRLSPRQSDLLIISGTVFKKVAPVVLRLYEQMAEPKWVISMGSCSNTGGMYDVYSVVQGVNQILPVDVYIPGCPPRPEAVLQGLNMLQEKISSGERPARSVFHLGGGSQGTTAPILVDGETKTRDTRGPGMNGIPIRGSSVTTPDFSESRANLMWTPPAAEVILSSAENNLKEQLEARFGASAAPAEHTSDMLTVHVDKNRAKEVLRFLKYEAEPGFARLEDYTAVDESARQNPADYPDFTLVYNLLAFEPPVRIRIKVPLYGSCPETESIHDLWQNAGWYEREIYDMFGLGFSGHPDLRRLIMPADWQGHPLRKSHPGRATDLPAYTVSDAQNLQPVAGEQVFRVDEDGESFVLNIGPHHTGTHGIIRYIARMEGETITGLDMDIGYHHRAAEKLGERQHWIQYIPYTDRVDYLVGAANEFPYVMAVEKLAGISVPERAEYIRVLFAELSRIANHMAYMGIMANDIGALTPNFYAFRDREMIMDIVELISGGRLHPAFFRPGGVAADLPENWREPVEEFLKVFPKRLREYENITMKNPVFKARTVDVGILDKKDAIDCGVTGPNLRSTGVNWDLRKNMPYSVYDQLDFDVPMDTVSDCWTRFRLRVEECRQSIRIIRQVLDHIPRGRYISEDYRYVVPRRGDMLKDIESLIHHFINVTRGPKIPRGEAYAATENPRGEQGIYVVSDGLGFAYRLRIRGASFTNVQVFPRICLGATIPDFIAILGAHDYTPADIDR